MSRIQNPLPPLGAPSSFLPVCGFPLASLSGCCRCFQLLPACGLPLGSLSSIKIALEHRFSCNKRGTESPRATEISPRATQEQSKVASEEDLAHQNRELENKTSELGSKNPDLPVPLPAPFVRWRLRQLFPYLHQDLRWKWQTVCCLVQPYLQYPRSASLPHSTILATKHI